MVESSEMNIVPAVLTESIAELRQMLSQAEGFTSVVQVDVMDGRFVPTRSITAQDLMKIKTNLSIEAHLMVYEPEEYLSAFKKAGAQRIVFHYEATDSPEMVMGRARGLGLKVGMAANPETPGEALEPFLGNLDCVLFLSVDPGFYGSPFIPEAVEKVRQFKRRHPGIEVGLDGGIKGWNLRRLEAFGVDYACIGSAIFKTDPSGSYLRLSRLLSHPTTPDFRPASPYEGILFELLKYLRHSPLWPDGQEQDRLVISPEFEPALTRVLLAFNYPAGERPFWVEVCPEQPAGRARDLATLFRQEESDVLVYALLSPQALEGPGAKDAAEAAAALKVNNLRMVVPSSKPPSSWHRAQWKVIQAPVSGLRSALDEAQRSWGNSSLILVA